jgi:hypothetical protein
MPNGNYSIT